jgi:hypothetical protein
VREFSGSAIFRSCDRGPLGNETAIFERSNSLIAMASGRARCPERGP